MQPFKGDTRFRDTVIKAFEFYESICKNEYREIVEIIKKDGEPSQEDQARIQQMLESVIDRHNAITEELLQVQREFAAKHGLEVAPEEKESQGK
jgi:Asp-tRNA(Asn)/Glu-tRNA(Gln) amidotransferase B subunit